ncbi:signal peptidase I [Virgibacillus subterraneus]|uniref:Signal peptidase I n=2 Tax=Virgibacillus TaxID=84406 RepID=A0A1H1CAL0_9BACI|nr:MULTISPECIES: signal peptidase I [Virgibacillus]SDQ61148.1 signal peptidase I [Virgibacillus salinus]SEQ59069.1 signal peptidase I [Virgibacillus subterraneus]
MAKQKSEWFDWIKALLIAFALAFIVRTFFFAPIVVDGPSMMPTLHDRDQMIVNKFLYDIDEPKRFDIVVFHASDQKDFIKRIIGLPGEHVAVDDDVLYINGEEVKEPFLTAQKQNRMSTNSLTSEFKLEELPGEYKQIPEDHVLVLGDNRNNSTDSRMLGLIPMDQIVGKTSLIYWPFDRMQTISK